MRALLESLLVGGLAALTLTSSTGCWPEVLHAAPGRLGARRDVTEHECALVRSSDGSRVAFTNDGHVTVANAPIEIGANGRERIVPVRFVADGDRIIARLARDSLGRQGDRIQLYDATTTGELLTSFSEDNWLDSYSNDGRYAVTVARERGVHYRIYDLRTGRAVLTTHAQFATWNDVKAGAFTGTDSFTGTGSFTAVYHYAAYSWIATWDLQTGRLVKTTTRAGWITDIASILGKK